MRATASCAISTSTWKTRCSSAASAGRRTRSPSGTIAASSTAPCGTTGPIPAAATASPLPETSLTDPYPLRPSGTSPVRRGRQGGGKLQRVSRVASHLRLRRRAGRQRAARQCELLPGAEAACARLVGGGDDAPADGPLAEILHRYHRN